MRYRLPLLICIFVSVVLTLLFASRCPVIGGEPEPFTIALTGKYPPFSFYSEEGKLIGFDVDVARAVAKHLDRRLEIVTTEWDGILAGLLVGKFDAIIGSMAVTPQRAKKVGFSVPYYVSGAQLFVHADAGGSIAGADAGGSITGIEDLDGKRIGVGLGETYEHYLREHHPEVEVVTYKSSVDYFQDMLNGRLEGFVTDRLVGMYQVKSAGLAFVPAGPLLYEEKMAIPVVKGVPELLADINGALAAMRDGGLFAELHRKWFSSGAKVAGTHMNTEVVVKKLGQGFLITLFVAFLSIALGFVISIPEGIILNKKRFFLYYPVRSFNDFIRGTPLLIQLFFVYFGAPQVGITLSPIQAAILTLTVNSSAYMAEVIRSGLMAVDAGQSMAGRALGLTKFQVFRYVVWPQAFRIALPPLMNVIIALMKDTALIAVISVSEVIREAQSIISVTYNPMKYYLIVAAMFFVFTFPLMKLAGRIEARLKEKGFANA